MKYTKLSLTIILTALSVMLSFSLPLVVNAQDEESEPRTSIIIADIDDEPIEKIEELQPLVDYLAEHLAEFGIESGEVMVAPDMESMIEWLVEGEVDIVFDSAYSALLLTNEAEAEPVLRRWKDGVDVYHGIFFAMADSGLESIEDLQGEVVSFNDLTSATGYMMPKALLMDMELNPVEVPNFRESVADDEVGYYLSGDDDTTVQLVISNRVVAGVIDSGDFAEIPEETRDEMVVLGHTEDVVRSVLIVRPEMDPELVEALSDTLIEMDEDEDAQEVMEIFETTKFDLFPGGVETAWEELQTIYKQVQDKKSEPRTSIIIADVDDEPIEKIEELQPLIDYLAEHLAEYGIESGEVMVAPDMETMIEWLSEGEVDIVFDSAISALFLTNQAEAEPILRRWKDGVDVYHGIFFAMADSGLESIEDLQGEIVSFKDLTSATGYIMPKALLMDLELNPVEVPNFRESVADDEVGYYLSGDDDTTVQLVISNRVTAGVIDNGDFEEIPEETRDAMVILGQTDDVVRSVMIVRSEMDPELLEALTELMIQMDEDADAEEVMEIFETTQFDLFPDGVETAWEELQTIYEMVQE